MQVTGMCRRWMTVVVVALVVGSYASRAEAAIEIKSESGWSASLDGFLNLFLVDTWGPGAPTAPNTGDVWSAPTDNNVFRVRTGFLPSAFGFNAGAPEWEGLKFKLRVGIYVEIQNTNTRTAPTGTYINMPLIDWREFNITMDGKFGQLLVGRALNLYQADAVLADISLFGVGIPGQVGGNVLGGWPTLGHIGFGYLYPAFGAQVRYTTPDLSGFKLAIEIGDPSKIAGPTPAATATITSLPDLEMTLSYSNKFDSVSLRAWLGGIFNRAWFANRVAGLLAPTGAVNGRGGSAGLGVGVSVLDLIASGFWAEGMGTFQQFDGGDSLDRTGAPVSSKGFLLQASAKIDKTKFGANYGQVMADRTTDQNTVNAPVIERRQALTFGVYHDLNSWLKLVAEYSWYDLKWYGGASQSGNVATVGGFFFW